MASRKHPPNFYSELPKSVEDDVKYLIKAKDEATKDEKEKKENKIEVFLKKQLPRHRLREGIVENLKHKVFFIDNAERPKKRYDRRRRCRHKLTSKEKRKLGLFKLPKQQSYESFIPLHNLWKDYMKDVIDFGKVTEENKASTAQQKLLKADYHGALVTVTKSKTPSLIGQTGIIIQETKNVFKIVARDDKMKTIPKENCIFTVELEGYVFNIQGSQFRFTAAERIHRKFKFRPRVAQDL